MAVDRACTRKLYIRPFDTHLVLTRSKAEVRRRCGILLFDPLLDLVREFLFLTPFPTAKNYVSSRIFFDLYFLVRFMQ